MGSATSILAWRRSFSGKDWRAGGSGGLKLQCIRNCHVFYALLIILFHCCFLECYTIVFFYY